MPEKGAAALAEALADACGDAIRDSTPVRSVVVEHGIATGVVVDGGAIEADAVVCAVPHTRAPETFPAPPADIHKTPGDITYSSGFRVVIGMDHSPLPPR